MLYASELARFGGRFNALFEDDPAELPDLVGKLLAAEVEKRMRRNLSRGYRQRTAVLSRVRGRIDMLVTATERLLDRGEVACRFDEHTLDTTRNRFVRASLERIARITGRQVSQRCRTLACDLGRAGVSGQIPSRSELARDQITRNETEDRFMMALAQLAFDLALPTEDAGDTPFTQPDRDEHWVRRLFEKAVAGFYAVELAPEGWKVRSGEILRWPTTAQSDGVAAILPAMRTDISLLAPDGSLTIIDTKFTAIVTKGWYREETLKSPYIYQLYAYLRSQERPNEIASPWNRSRGMLLHPAVDQVLHESVQIQGHQIEFTTVDLASSPATIRRSLLEIATRAIAC